MCHEISPNCHELLWIVIKWVEKGINRNRSGTFKALPPLGTLLPLLPNTAGWPNGKALDYESRDCRFDPCVGQFFFFLFLFFLFNLSTQVLFCIFIFLLF
ncbi:hypothetical protein ACN38_g11434 [Penicillium nordicum]|uniref:Uncharacterized protein n=1 Tax=Penicillium nordicum TaxID=229535 RepID=A0A0M9WB52_9EURO|nr:hypothetical protein ACN38_g11434 [Penicillium nordicum]